MIDGRLQRTPTGQRAHRHRRSYPQPKESSTARLRALREAGNTKPLQSAFLSIGIQTAPGVSNDTAEQKFDRLARQWRRETRHLSSITALSMNDAYQKIIGMGKDALPFILRDLRKTHDHWLWALSAIVDDNPTTFAEDSNEAIAAWLNWGTEQGYLP